MHKPLFILIAVKIIMSAFMSVAVISADSQDTTVFDDLDFDRGYAIVMANGTVLKVSEYAVDLDRETVYFKSLQSGLSATFPLERITRVVLYDRLLETVPDDAMPLFIPERTVNEIEDDGGIPVIFNVTRTVVGSSGAPSGYARAGGDRPADHRQGYTPSRTTSGPTGSTARPSTAPTQTRPGTSRQPSSGDAADNFFNALFGGSR